MKAEYLEDLKLYRFKITRGMYFIDGKVIDIESYMGQEMQAKSIEIKKIDTSSIITHYENAEGERLERDDRESKRLKLLEKAKDGYDDIMFDHLDDEYAYKKFMRDWTSCHREIVSHGDPIPVEIIRSQYETGNKFITAMLSPEEREYGLFIYNRPGAVYEIVKDIFDDLDMSFQGNMDHSETKSKKVWGNSKHSGVRFITAFGTYALSDRWDVKIYRGSLEACLSRYELDNEELNTILRSQYAAHFLKGGYELEKLLSQIKGINSAISGIDSKVKTKDAYHRARKLISDMEKEVRDELAQATRKPQ